MAQKTKKSIFFSFSAVFIILLSVFLFNYPLQSVQSADESVSCNSTTLDQTALDALAGDDVTFTDGGDGICIFTGTLSANSVTVNADVTLTHNAQGFDKGGGVYAGVEITTVEDFTLNGSINVNSKGCQNNGTTGWGPDSNNICTSGVAGAATDSSRGAGYGGNGGGLSAGSVSGIEYGSATNPVLFGSSGADGNGRAGGDGGGLIVLIIGGNFVHNGAVSANGGDGYASCCHYGGGGGSGGAINIAVTGEFQGSTGTFSADGGRGGYQVSVATGGGGGGRIAFSYGSTSYAGFDSSKISLDGGLGNSSGASGALGTGYVKDITTNDVTIYHGFKFDSDISAGSFSVDTTEANLYCGSSDPTLSITANDITLAGTMSCTDSAITSFDTQSATGYSLEDFTLTLNGVNATSKEIIQWTLNDNVPMNLINSTINGNVHWTNLASLSIDSTSSISANSKGCQNNGTTGWGPDSNNICTSGVAGAATGGARGAGYGGNGGGTTPGSISGLAYGSETDPVLIGSSGGDSNGRAGGDGGGLIYLSINGNFVHNGTISANGGNGYASCCNYGGGGGSGGAINLAVNGELQGSTGAFSATGGRGGYQVSAATGGGGGGRVAIKYAGDNSSYLSSLATETVATGGLGNSTGQAGSTGTLYTFQYSSPDEPTTTGVDNSRNLTLNTSAYSSDGASHTSTDWKVCTNLPCEGDQIVWSSIGDTTNLESITVNTTNGIFANDLAGKTKLAPNTNYQVKALHTNTAGNSSWGGFGTTTVANNNPSTPTNSTPSNGASDQSKTPTLTSSTYSDSDGDSHGSTTWNMYDDPGCAGDAIWSSVDDSTNKESITLADGTFAGTHIGQTELKGHNRYSWQITYKDEYSGELTSSNCTAFDSINTTPTANAGTDQAATEEDEVTLTATSTDDDWNDTPTNTWIESLDSSDGCTLSGTTVTTLNKETSYTCQFQVEADDGQGTTDTDTMTLTVTATNDAPVFGSIASTQTIDEEDTLIISFTATDPDTSSLTLSASNLPTSATFTDNTNNTGTFNWTPDGTQSGTHPVTFQLTDGETTVTQTVTITVNDTVQDEEEGDDEDEETPDEEGEELVNTIDDIGLITGSESGLGIVTLYDNENNELCSVQAWSEGGAVPTTVRFQDNYYVSVVKNRTGSTIHLYDLNCNLVEKKKLSAKLHPRNMIARNFLGKSTSQEIALTSRRGSTVYGKIFRYNPTKDKWYLLRQKTFRPVPTEYTLDKTKKGNILIKKNNKTLHKWEI